MRLKSRIMAVSITTAVHRKSSDEGDHNTLLGRAVGIANEIASYFLVNVQRPASYKHSCRSASATTNPQNKPTRKGRLILEHGEEPSPAVAAP
jgi:hypothetical protein